MSKSRREFLRQLAFGTAEASPGVRQQHTLVCVFLRGGADTLNMIVPYGDDDYYRARPTIALKPPGKGSGSALKLDDRFGLHPKMAPLLPAYKEGRLAVVHSVGSDNVTGSHFEAQDQMEHGEAYKKTIGSGWLGRHMHCRSGQDTPLSAVAIGVLMPEALRGAPSVSVLRTIDDVKIKTSGDPRAVAAVLAAMYGADTGVLSLPGKNTLELLERIDKVRNEPVYKVQGKLDYPSDEFAQGLREVARLIKADAGLEVACLDVNGWDTHFVQGQAEGLQADRIAELAGGLAAFDADLAKHRERYTVLVLTEFGRRIYENVSGGTDHGRGFSVIAIGDKIDGGKMHGKWPGLDDYQDDILGPAQFDILGPAGLGIHIDYRCVLGEILAGVLDNKQTNKVFPGLDYHPARFVKL